jgi:hypothetical protein
MVQNVEFGCFQRLAMRQKPRELMIDLEKRHVWREAIEFTAADNQSRMLSGLRKSFIEHNRIALNLQLSALNSI